ncbi:MAG: ATP-grasp domain-containing protein [Planctomycetota bacterium]
MINVLFTCIGRRVSLLNCFRRAARGLKINASFIGTDTFALSPALQLCDKKYIVKPIKHPGYLKELLGIVKQNRVKLLVPTIDTELMFLAKNRTKFAALGCHVVISEPEVIDICQDKRKTHRFLKRNDFDAPATMTIRTALAKKNLTWPVLLKPWDGSAGKGVAVANNRKELSLFGRRIPNCIVQEFIKGNEHTCDAYVDFDMKLHCVVPRKRIEVRAGEVSKAQVVKNQGIMAKVAEVVEKLGAGPGVITVQLVLTTQQQSKIIEINPRFGGGAPLAIKAGANFPKWILQELLGKRPKIKFDGFKDNLIMLRYDSEIWL